MPIFHYEALNPQNKVVKGTFEAVDDNFAAKELRSRKMMIISLNEQEEEEEKKDANISHGFGGIKKREILGILKQLASLIASGISVAPALHTLEEQTNKKKLKYILRDIYNIVEEGNSLSVALSRHEKYVNNMAINLVKAGEATGLVDNALFQAVDYLEKKEQLKKQVISSFMYPCVVMVITICVVIFLVLFVIPPLIPILEMNGGEMPPNTQFLIDITASVQKNYKQIILTVLGIVFIIYTFLRSSRGRLLFDRYSLKIPMFGSIRQINCIIQISRTLSLMLASGIGIVEALQRTQDTLTNTVYQIELSKIEKAVLSGQRLSEPIARSRYYFPPMVLSLIKVGEETGGIDSSLMSLANMYDDLLKDKVKLLNAMIEPFLIMLMAGMVGYVALALISGMLAGYGA